MRTTRRFGSSSTKRDVPQNQVGEQAAARRAGCFAICEHSDMPVARSDERPSLPKETASRSARSPLSA